MTHDPNLIHWQIAQHKDDPSEAVQACLALFRVIAGNEVKRAVDWRMQDE